MAAETWVNSTHGVPFSMKCLPTSRALALGALGFAFALPVAQASAADTGPTKWVIGFADDVVTEASGNQPDAVYLDWEDGTRPAESTAIVMKVERAGSVISASDYPSRYGSFVSMPDLRAGDVATFSDKNTGVVVAQAAYDGRPSFDATTCNGSTGFTGLRTAASAIDSVGGFTLERYSGRDDYGGSYSGWDRTQSNSGTVISLVGEAFGGTFARPIATGTFITAKSHRDLTADILIRTTVTRQVGGCPPPPPAPADTSAPSAGLSAPTAKKLKKITLGKLISAGLKLSVKPNEASTVNAQLLLRKSKKSKKPPTVLATTTLAAAAGVDTQFKLKLPKKAKKKLRGLPGSAKLLIHVTVTDGAGNVTTLPDVAFKVPKK